MSSLNIEFPTFQGTLNMLCAASCVLLASGAARGATSYDGNRWFSIEVSIFSNEANISSGDELWSANRFELAYPARLRRFDSLFDFLEIDQLELPDDAKDQSTIDTAQIPSDDSQENQDTEQEMVAVAAGPRPYGEEFTISLPDFQRDPYLQLPPNIHDFADTNRTLRNSSEHRLLFHKVWRQPVLSTRRASPLLVEGGEQYDGQYELQGSINIHFNANQDRVVIDADLWLIKFTTDALEDGQWILPALPENLQVAVQTDSEPPADNGIYSIDRVIQLLESRDMRSDEFHYLDHPKLGLLVIVQRYDLPLPVEIIPVPPR